MEVVKMIVQEVIHLHLVPLPHGYFTRTREARQLPSHAPRGNPKVKVLLQSVHLLQRLKILQKEP